MTPHLLIGALAFSLIGLALAGPKMAAIGLGCGVTCGWLVGMWVG